MSRRLRLIIASVGIAIVILVGVVALGGRDVALEGYAAFIAGIVIVRLIGRLHPAEARRLSAFDEARRRGPPELERLPELERVEREVTLGAAYAFDLHYRLRKRVREVAATRLASRRGIDLDREPDAAKAVVDPELWELIRPDREPPRDRQARGVGAEGIRGLVEALDRI